MAPSNKKSRGRKRRENRKKDSSTGHQHHHHHQQPQPQQPAVGPQIFAAAFADALYNLTTEEMQMVAKYMRSKVSLDAQKQKEAISSKQDIDASSSHQQKESLSTAGSTSSNSESIISQMNACSHGGIQPQDFLDSPKARYVVDAMIRCGIWTTDECGVAFTTGQPLSVVREVISKFPKTIEDEEIFLLLKAQMISLGIDALLEKPTYWEFARWWAGLVICLENEFDRFHEQQQYIEENRARKNQQPPPTLKRHCKQARDLYGERGITMFFDSQVECKCLKDFYMKFVKNKPKMGCCYYCLQEKEYIVMKKCKRCSVAHYCNRQCQVHDWANHQIKCNNIVEGTADPLTLLSDNR